MDANEEKTELVPVRVHGITADPATNQFLMLLIDNEGNRLLPIVIGQFEAQSIAWNIQGVIMQRPLTHDLFCNVLENINTAVIKIIIDNLKDNTFFAKISIKTGDSILSIDSRPSDAVAIAVRTKAPIFVVEDVIDKAAVKIDKEVEKQEKVNETDLLNKKLDEAVEQENYEEAAILRDKIKKLAEKSNN